MKNQKRSKNIDLLAELPFYEEMNIIKTNHAFGGNATSYKVELIEKKDPTEQLEASKSSVKDLFSDLLDETKGFKYQLTLKVVLKNTSQMEKLNLDQFISIQQQKQWCIINSLSKMFFKNFSTELEIGLMKDLVGLLN